MFLYRQARESWMGHASGAGMGRLDGDSERWMDLGQEHWGRVALQ